MTPRYLRHNRINLALHTLREAEGQPLLLLHGLGEHTPTQVPSYATDWDGPIYGLDFTGHGASTMPAGGGYTAEILLADADTALRHIGPATVMGRGLGAYIALQLAGARADRVLGTVLGDGPGLSGGPSVPTSQPIVDIMPSPATPDPYALLELGRDLRPPDYAATFTRLAVQGSPLDDPIAVVSFFRPAWLDAVADEHGVALAESVPEALDLFANIDDWPEPDTPHT